MRADRWNPERFRLLIKEIQERTGLGDSALGPMAGLSRSQFNRWSRAENQPSHKPLRTLYDSLIAHDPELRVPARDLLIAAGYDPPSPGLALVEVPTDVSLTEPPADVEADLRALGVEWADLSIPERKLWLITELPARVRQGLWVMLKTVWDVTKKYSDNPGAEVPERLRRNGS